MNISNLDTDNAWCVSQEDMRKNVESHCSIGRKQFKKIIHSYLFFHLFFIGLFLMQVIGFCILLTFHLHSPLIPFSLAGLILTAFAYLILLIYFQAKKPEQFIALQNSFMRLCHQAIPLHLAPSEAHLFLAHAAYRFASHLHQDGLDEIAIKPSTLALNHLLQKAVWVFHRNDLHKMQEMLFLVSIREHIELIKKTPTNVEVHASLAHAYVALSKLYLARVDEGLVKEAEEQFKTTAQRAIQEFHIIDHFSPNDPWVHAQLASCYRDLNMIQKETESYEVILKLCPNDKEIMFRLGILYFKQGLCGRGLEMYEKLLALRFSRAHELLEFYDLHPIHAV